jgi:alpha-D-xyloside xylohydrolase
MRTIIAALMAVSTLTATSIPATAQTPVVLDRDGAWVSLEAFGPRIVRVTISTRKEEVERGPGHGIITNSEQPQALTPITATAGDQFSAGDLQVQVSPTPARRTPGPIERYFASPLTPINMRFGTAAKPVLLEMANWSLSPHVVNGESTFQVAASFRSRPDEHYYGLGQNQEGKLDLRGRTIDCRTWYAAPHGQTVCIPFMMSSAGYGIVWDNPSATTVTVGVHSATTFASKVGERVSFLVIQGDTSQQILAEYSRLTGRAPIPPKAAFGLIQSKARYGSQDEVLEVANTYRRKNYPLDIMVVDWFYWTKVGQLDIDPAQFPDPEAMNQQLRDMGMRSMISFFPRFEKTSRYFDELQSKGFMLKNKDGTPVDGVPFRNERLGGLIDATNPEARAWYWQRIRDNVLSRGFDYPWLDANEPNLIPDGYFYSIGTGDRYKHIFPLLHVEGVANGLREWRPDRRVTILSRAAYLGSQRTGALFWSSDIHSTWEAFQRQVPTGLNMAASGITYWSSDIGGWLPIPPKSGATKAPLLDPAGSEEVAGTNTDYPELFTRWFQHGVFTPTLRVHGLRKANELWSFGPAAEAVLADYLRLRYRLMPYIYSLAKQNYDTSVPMMRPLWMDFPEDKNVATIGSQYMFGPAFLVAPVTEQGQTVKRVYLPAGEIWYDYWTNEKYEGGQWVDAQAPIERIPLFVRAGSIIPIGSDVASTASAQSIVNLVVYPGRDGAFTLYDDDGSSYDYERGKGATSTQLIWQDKTGQLSVEGNRNLSREVPRILKVIGR